MAQKDRKEKTVLLELTVNQVQKESLESVNQERTVIQDQTEVLVHQVSLAMLALQETMDHKVNPDLKDSLEARESLVLRKDLRDQRVLRDKRVILVLWEKKEIPGALDPKENLEHLEQKETLVTREDLALTATFSLSKLSPENHWSQYTTFGSRSSTPF